LCGAVQYDITPPFLDFAYCHCERCRKSFGGAFSTHLFLDPKQLRWVAGQDLVTLFLHEGADNYPRGFCRRCGGPVPRMARDGVRMSVPAGTLEQDPGIRPTKNIFWSLKPAWDECRHNLPTFDERPPKK
jgi:hypothetical protein